MNAGDVIQQGAMVGGKIGEISGKRMRKLGSRLARFIETGRA